MIRYIAILWDCCNCTCFAFTHCYDTQKEEAVVKDQAANELMLHDAKVTHCFLLFCST